MALVPIVMTNEPCIIPFVELAARVSDYARAVSSICLGTLVDKVV